MHTANVVVAWINAVQDRLRAQMRELGAEGRDLAALTLVAAYDGCSQDWLRPRIELTQSGTVRLVDRLAARGLPNPGAATGPRGPLHPSPRTCPPAAPPCCAPGPRGATRPSRRCWTPFPPRSGAGSSTAWPGR